MKYSFFMLTAINVFSLAAMETPNFDVEAQNQLSLNDQCKNLMVLEYDERYGLEQLRELSLYSKQIKNLEEGICILCAMKQLNQLEQQSKLLQNTTLITTIALRRLNLSRNELKSLPQSFATLQDLKHIDLSNNKFDLFPEVLCSLPKLTMVNVSNNKIPTIPTTISNLINLKNFNVASNSITKIPDQIGALPHLKVLTTQGNPITEPVSDEILALVDYQEAARIQRATIGVVASLKKDFSILYNKVVLRASGWGW